MKIPNVIVNVFGGFGIGKGICSLILQRTILEGILGLIALIGGIFLTSLSWYRLGFKVGMLDGIIKGCSDHNVAEIFDKTFKQL